VLDQNQLILTVDSAPCALGAPPSNISDLVGMPSPEPAKPQAGCAPTSVHAKVTDQINVDTKAATAQGS
jgi:hypothetical protein